jgi:hypothetical protein
MTSERLVPNHVWVAIEPLLPQKMPRLHGSRRFDVRSELRGDLLHGPLHLTCVLLCLRFREPAPG